MADFSNSITSLRLRAKKARISFLMIGIGVLALVAYAFTFVVFRYTQDKQISKMDFIKESRFVDAATSPEALFFPFIKQELYKRTDNKTSFSEKEGKNVTSSLATLVVNYEKIKKADSSQGGNKNINEEGRYGQLVATFALSVGAIALIVFLLQIAVTFLRYYARLAELYEAQADALEASEGNPVVAYDFIEKFTPLTVDFDKLPHSLYEKSIDAVIDIAKSRK